MTSLVIVALALVPIASLLWQASGDSGGVWPHLITNVLPQSAGTTLLLLVGVGFFTLLLGSSTAWLICRYRFPLHGILRWALVLPLAIPTYLAAYTWTEFFDFTGPVQSLFRAVFGFENARQYWFPDIRSTGGAVFLISLVLFPYVYLPALLSFRMQSMAVLDVARVLGAGPIKMFFKVALPAARPAVAVGVMLALMETLNDIGAVEHLGVRTLTFSVFDTWLNRSSLAGAAQIALILLAVVVLLVMLEKRLRADRGYSDIRGRAEPPVPVRLEGAGAFAATLWCLLPILLGFGVPLFQLVKFTLLRFDQVADSGLLDAALNSLSVATATAVICVVAGFTVIYGARRSGRTTPPVVVQIAGLGYAIPGTILAIGVLTALTGFDNTVSSFVRRFTGESTGLILSGTMAIIVYACSVRFLAISLGNIEAGYQKISPNLFAAARTLGRSEGAALREVELPLLAKTIGTAGLMVLVETMKELSATLLLRPFNFNTLATYVYERASRALFEDAAFAALLIVLIGLLPVYILTRVIISEQNGRREKKWRTRPVRQSRKI